MEISGIDPINLSADAALELEELKQGHRTDVPALISLFDYVRTPAPAFTGSSVSMLADVRSYALLRDSVGRPTPKNFISFKDFSAFIDAYFNELEKGVKAHNASKIDEAKRFCLAFNANLVTKQMTDIYDRKGGAESRYVSHESIS